jgi:hypothetical protein
MPLMHGRDIKGDDGELDPMQQCGGIESWRRLAVSGERVFDVNVDLRKILEM